jgi:hypothetical protein
MIWTKRRDTHGNLRKKRKEKPPGRTALKSAARQKKIKSGRGVLDAAEVDVQNGGADPSQTEIANSLALC